MMVAGAVPGSVAVGSLLQDPGAITDPLALHPIRLTVRGIDVTEYFLANSLDVTETQSQVTTCRITLVNPAAVPVVGDPVTVRFHDYLVFAGSIDRVNKEMNGPAVLLYQCECLDPSFILMRRRLRRNFTEVPIHTILTSILQNELAGEQLSIGIIESLVTIPLADAGNAPVYDVLRDMAAMTGQILTIDGDGTIHMRSSLVPSAPVALTESVCEITGAGIEDDREAYRNVQVVIATGTPPQGEDARVMIAERTNDEQIAARAVIEGGSGRYEAIEEVTHPTSNTVLDLNRLATGLAPVLLSLGGTPRQTFSCVTRGYGFRAGQVCSVNLPTFSVIGTFQVQRARLSLQAGTTTMRQELELTTSSLQQRSYERILQMVRQGKVTVQPSALAGVPSGGSQAFSTVGTFQFVVPAGVTLMEMECWGASGGGGGGASAIGLDGHGTATKYANGGLGGNSGKALSIVEVVEGQTLDIVVGSGGTGGTSVAGAVFSNTVGTDGGTGGLSSVKLGAATLCQGNGGGGGTGGRVNAAIIPPAVTHGTNGSAGSGIGNTVTTGGGKTGGSKGTGNPFVHGSVGQHGYVEVRW